MAGLPGYCYVIVGTLLAVAVSVLLHYEGLYLMVKRYRSGGGATGRRQMLLVILWLLLLHGLQIAIFGLGWWALLELPATGSVSNVLELHWHGALFLSTLAYTSLGFDTWVPQGAIRIMAGAEALTGLVMVAWSASFAFLQMQRHWKME